MPRVECDEGRAETLGTIIGMMGIDAVLAMEKDDPQYHAIEDIVKVTGPGPAMTLAILVSLVSYRLPLRGEDWWKCLAEHVVDNLDSIKVTDIEALLPVLHSFLVKCNASSIEKRMNRIRRVVLGVGDILHRLAQDPGSYPRLANALWNRLSSTLRQDPGAKTIVFSLKMLYYVYRASRLEGSIASLPSPPIPVDSRVACLTYSSMLCDASDYREIVRRPAAAQRIWEKVSRVSGISTLHMDALAWRLGWIPRDTRDLEKAISRAFEVIRPYTSEEIARHAAREFIRRLCLPLSRRRT